MNFYNLVSFLGLFVFLFLVWALSENRRQVNYRTVLTGLGIMLLFAFFIFLFLNNVFLVFLNYRYKLVDKVPPGLCFLPIYFANRGIPFEDVLKISGVIGERPVLTEVVSYQDLAKLIKDGQITNHRIIVVISYALWGFAHFASRPFSRGLS